MQTPTAPVPDGRDADDVIHVVPPREPHPGEDCAVWWESATSPAPSGRFTVTEHCKCGNVLATYTDSVL